MKPLALPRRIRAKRIRWAVPQPLGTSCGWRWFCRCGRQRRRLQHILGRQRHRCGPDNGERSSIITDPLNGRLPPVTDAPYASRPWVAAPRWEGGANDGTAYWLDAGLEAPGPYDNPETDHLLSAASCRSAHSRAAYASRTVQQP